MQRCGTCGFCLSCGDVDCGMACPVCGDGLPGAIAAAPKHVGERAAGVHAHADPQR